MVNKVGEKNVSMNFDSYMMHKSYTVLSAIMNAFSYLNIMTQGSNVIIYAKGE